MTRGHTFIDTIGISAKNYVHASIFYRRACGAFYREIECKRREIKNKVIYFTRHIRHGGNRLHLALPPSRSRTPHPMGINLWTYTICDVRGFVLPQEIWAAEQSNYELMLLIETKIPDRVYCRNLLGYNIL